MTITLAMCNYESIWYKFFHISIILCKTIIALVIGVVFLKALIYIVYAGSFWTGRSSL